LFKFIEDYLSFTGPHIKSLSLFSLKMDCLVAQQFLSMFPNLEEIKVYHIQDLVGQSLHWSFKSPKIQRVSIQNEFDSFESFLESLESSTIKELHINGGETPEFLHKFLKAQEKNLKSLSFNGRLSDFLVTLKDLRLERLEMGYQPPDSETHGPPIPDSHTDWRRFQVIYTGRVPMEFLKQQVDLRFLKLKDCALEGRDFALICGLEKLEELEITKDSRAGDPSGLDQLHKLQRLKKLEVAWDVSQNILDHLQFGVFEDLEELDACFVDASLESIREMKRITPNLKKLVVQFASAETINAMLETLDNLETLKVRRRANWSIPAKPHPKIKYIKIDPDCEVTTDYPTKFPNLQRLHLRSCPTELTETLLIDLLTGLKRLKELRLINRKNYMIIDAQTALKCFREFGRGLEILQINTVFRHGPNKIVDGYEMLDLAGNFVFIKKLIH
jgi:hypothetical protein